MYTFLAVRWSHSSRRHVLLSTQAVLSLEMDSHLRIDWGDMNFCFWWFKLDCYSLNLKPFHLYKSSKNLIDCLLFLFQGHHNQLANIRGSRWSVVESAGLGIQQTSRLWALGQSLDLSELQCSCKLNGGTWLICLSNFVPGPRAELLPWTLLPDTSWALVIFLLFSH